MALCLKQVFAKDKTFRPRKRFEPGTQRFELYKKAQASLKSGLDLRSVVRLPPGENIDDWIAVHVVDFFNRINLIYGTMAERCSETSCPVMAGGPRYEYRWQDERQYRRPAKLSAPRYMALLMDWIEGLINDEDVFPTRVGECHLAGRSRRERVTGAHFTDKLFGLIKQLDTGGGGGGGEGQEAGTEDVV